jgi:hypothetical protein
MRPSVAVSRVSAGVNSAAVAKLGEKKKEYDAVAAVDRLSQVLLDRIEGFAEDCDVMALAGKGK